MHIILRCLQACLILVVLGGAAGCTKQSRIARLLARGDKDYRAEQFDRAEIEYQNVLKLAPQTPAAMSRLGLTYYAEGKLPQAFVCLREAVKLEPENCEVRLKLGLTCFSLNRVKEAREAAKLVFQKQPTNEDACVLLADSAVTTNDMRETWQMIEALPPAAKDKAAYHLARGTLYGRQHDLDKAEAEFKQAAAKDPKSSAAFMALGTLYLFRNDLKQAETALKTSAELAPLRSTRRLKYAEFKLRTGAAEEGRKAIEELTKKAPDYVPAWVFLAQTAFADRKTEECAALLKRIQARDPMNYDALMLDGKLALMQGQATNAITQLERISTVYPGASPQVDYLLALAYLLNKDFSKATASLNRAIAAAPDFPEAILLLAELNMRKGNPAPAIASLTQLIKKHPQLSKAHLTLANAYLAQKNPEEAVAVLRRMKQLFPKNPEIPFLMGTVLALQNKTDARRAYEEALAISPEYFPALEKIVDLDLLDKQYAVAMDRVNKQMEKNSTAPEPRLLSAKIHLEQAKGFVAREQEKAPAASKLKLRLSQVPAAQPDLNQAEAALQKAIDLNPNLQIAYLMLAQLYVASEKQQQALDRLNGYLAKTNDVVALMLLGMIHDQSKNYPAARDAYEKLLKTNPRFGAALNNLAYLYSARFGQLDKGYQLAEKARELQPSDPHTTDTLGWILYQKGEYTRSLGLLQESAAKLPANPEIQFHLGMAHYMMGEEEPARLALQRTIQGDKDFPEKSEASRRLAMLTTDVESTNAAVKSELEQWLQQNPNDPIALSKLGALQECDGAIDKAVRTYQAALKLNPDNVQVMLRLALAYSDHMNDPQRAMELMKAAHARAPEDARISHVLGRLAFQQGDHKWATDLLEESLRKLPNDPEVLYDAAWARYSLGRVAEAEAVMASVAKAGPASSRSGEAKRFMDLCAASRDPILAERAAAEAQKILSADPNYVPALMVSAVAQEQRRNYREAGQLYDRILARYPLFAPASRNLAMLCCAQLSDDQKAYNLALKAHEALPQDADLAKTLGVLAYRRGDYSRSAQVLKESAPRRNNDGELLFYLGMAQYRLKQAKDAKAALLQALALNVPAKLTEEARKVLAELK